MDIDVTKHLGAIERVVERRELDGKEAWVTIATRVYDTDIDDVWDAITNPERIPRWFAPVSGDLRLGGSYQIEGNASGEVTQCEPPRSFALTWCFGGGVSWVTVALAEGPGESTTLRLEHVAHVPEEFAEKYGPGAGGVGWDLSFVGLGEYLASGKGHDPKEAEAWSLSEQGRAFTSGSSDAWARASIAAGTPEAAALAAAANTTKFYQGEPH
jgi:uncharacterized protein YndB with AHSA1/START domain